MGALRGGIHPRALAGPAFEPGEAELWHTAARAEASAGGDAAVPAGGGREYRQPLRANPDRLGAVRPAAVQRGAGAIRGSDAARPHSLAPNLRAGTRVRDPPRYAALATDD